MLLISALMRKLKLKPNYDDQFISINIKPCHEIIDMSFLDKERFMQVIDVVRKNNNQEVYEIGGSWGDKISWNSIEDSQVVGWKFRIPKEGDLLKAEMESGEMGVYAFVNIDRQSDPKDMFFADVRFIGYKRNDYQFMALN